MNQPPHSFQFFTSPRLPTAIALWAVGLAAALAYLGDYAASEGDAGEPPRQWLDEAPWLQAESGGTLVMFAHPRCPCTRASLRELAIILAARPSFGRVYIAFQRPEDADAGWSDSMIVRQAAALSGVEVVWDVGGVAAASFGAKTSGHVLVYDEHGELSFSGGVTGLRGHDGWNLGRASVAALGDGSAPIVDRTAVFGCPLLCSDVVATSEEDADDAQ